MRVVPIILALHIVLATPAGSDPFVFFGPAVVVSADDRRQLDRGEPLARTLPAENREVAVFAAVPMTVDGDRLVAWARQIAELKKSQYVLAIGRFSNPPRLEDLSGLVLDDDELSQIARCRRGDCGLKLTAVEMGKLQRTIAAAGSAWQPAVQAAFRRLVLGRVQAYLERGHAAFDPYASDDRPVSLDASFSRLVRHSAFLAERLPGLTEYLVRYPGAPMREAESFVYWSKERLGAKPIIIATHVAILRGRGEGLPDALVAGKQIFATRYMNGALALTAIVRGGPGSPSYLAYLNRSEVDSLSGFFGGIIRWFVERRVRSDAAEVLRGLATRLESGAPPPGSLLDIRSSTGTTR